MQMYDFEPERVKNFIRENGIEHPAIQLPDGLKECLSEILKPFEEIDVNPVILSESCHGACDLADYKAKRIGADALIHYGHADMGFATELPTLYVEARIQIDPEKVLEDVLSTLEGSVWGLTTTVQHVEHLEEVQEFLKENHVDSIIGQSGDRTKYPGQVLGCDWAPAKSISEEVDGFIYLGTGRFHPIGISLATGKNVVVINLISGGHELLSPDLNDFLDQRKAMLSRAASRKFFGIIVCTKIGQKRLGLAEKLRDEFESEGCEVQILVVDELSPEKLDQFQNWAFVSTACPRIALDDADLFENPILTPFEARVLLGEEDLEPYQLDEFC